MEKREAIPHLIQAALDEAAVTKPVEIQLAWYLNDYKVVAILNSTILKPGEWLTVGAVDQLCKTKGWTVKIVDNDVIQMLFGLGSGAVSAVMKV